MQTEQSLNQLIQSLKVEQPNFQAGEISDGFHTFNELYEHRIALFIALCRAYREHAWKSRKHANGEEWDGWFIMGLFTEQGKQISYHLPISYWEMLVDIHTLEQQESWDGHAGKELVNRIQTFNQNI